MLLHETDYLLKKFAEEFKPFTFVETSYLNIECASLNYHNKMKTEPTQLIPQKLIAKPELAMVYWQTS